MTFDYAHLIPVVPEIAVLVLASILLLVDLWLKDREKGINHVIAVLGLLIAIGLTGLVGGGDREIVLGGTYVRDPMSDLLKIAILLISLLTFVYSRDYLRDRQMMVGEFYVLTLFAVLGMMVMVSANSFLTLYLGLELLALSLYTLVAFDRDSPNGAEAAMKYFVLGALGSGLLLYGLSMLYGATGSLELGAVAGAVALQGATNQVLVFGLVFVVIGIGFKFGAVPFHMWVPDTYQGAPNPVVLFLGSAPKIAAFALAFRLLVDGLGALHEEWQGMLIILAIISMAVGNIVAIAQTNIKRMLAYSTISHVGFIFLGLIGGNGEAYSAAMFYAIVYALMAAGGFGLLVMMSREGLRGGAPGGSQGHERARLLAGRHDGVGHVLHGRGTPDSRLHGQTAGSGGRHQRGPLVARPSRRLFLHHRRLLLSACHQDHVLRQARNRRAPGLRHRRPPGPFHQWLGHSPLGPLPGGPADLLPSGLRLIGFPGVPAPCMARRGPGLTRGRVIIGKVDRTHRNYPFHQSLALA